MKCPQAQVFTVAHLTTLSTHSNLHDEELEENDIGTTSDENEENGKYGLEVHHFVTRTRSGLRSGSGSG
jgi:hypothetical protein